MEEGHESEANNGCGWGKKQGSNEPKSGVCRNLNYWDSVSTLAGEVPNPAKTFPRALFGAVILVTTTYALPLIVGLGVTTDIADWKLGYFASLAKQVMDT